MLERRQVVLGGKMVKGRRKSLIDGRNIRPSETQSNKGRLPGAFYLI